MEVLCERTKEQQKREKMREVVMTLMHVCPGFQGTLPGPLFSHGTMSRSNHRHIYGL